jgi:hypothetical protein
MSYQTVLIYDANANFLGYTILRPRKEDQPFKLQTTNVWTDEQVNDLSHQLERLNDQRGILAHWPSYSDPEVMELVGNPDWEPVADEPIEVVDEENSTFVWIQEPSEEEPLGQLDEPASNIVTKYVYGPPPVLVQARIKKAQEIVARRRMGQ